MKRRINGSTSNSRSQASAGRWFDNVNHHVKHTIQSNSDFDRDPPFYLNPPIHEILPALADVDLPFGKHRGQPHKDDSENGDLRSVIDDLTIENKRLRQVLRERRQPHNSQLDRNKLFEVRTSRLSSEKRRELGSILQRFASSMFDGPIETSQVQENGCGLHSASSAVAQQSAQEAPPLSRPDSAYASMSNSGQTTAAPPFKGKADVQPHLGCKNNKIQSYLHDIPDSLLPKHSPIMSEKSKMRLVVRRLEQLFTGKNANPCEHSQPLQQQKVSESAASADRHSRRLFDAPVQPEGAREARIHPCDSKMDIDFSDFAWWNKQSSSSKSGSDKSSNGTSASEDRSPDQRPTRPLDLDIHRAQVARENIDYIRHLGLPTPVDARNAENADEGWVYLNLLINMAQLHTINVTPSFIRKSIAHHSTKLELSKDARKIRWNGSCDPAEASDESDSGGELGPDRSPHLNQELINGKPAKDNSGLASIGSARARFQKSLPSLSFKRNRLTDSTNPHTEPSKETETLKTASAFDYKPIFLPEGALPRELSLSDDSDQMISPHGIDDLIGQDLGTHRNSMSHHYPGKSEDDGLLIYYDNPLFYCDLSSEKEAQEGNMTTEIALGPKQVLGLCIAVDESDQGQQALTVPIPQNALNYLADEECLLPSFELAPMSELVDRPGEYMELQASGIGGVLPEDHFMIQVHRRIWPLSAKKAPVTTTFFKRPRRPIIEDEIVSTIRFDLPASKLPPPSYVFLPLSTQSSSSLESDEYSSRSSNDSDIEAFDESYPAPPAFLSHFPTDVAEKRSATGDGDDESGSRPSTGPRQVIKAGESVTGADGRSESNRAAVLSWPVDVNTGSLVAAVGAGSGVSSMINSEGGWASGSEWSMSTESI